METTASGDLIAATQSALSPFALFRPNTVAEAVAAFAAAPRPAVFHAGGTDLFARLREGWQPAALVALSRVAELRAVTRTGDTLVIGAGVTHAAAAGHPALDAVPGLAAAWARIATRRIRGQATLGGNLMARQTRYELAILLAALDASATLAGPDGQMTLRVADLWSAAPDSHPLLVSVAVPLAGRPRLAYDRGLRPLATLATCLRDTGARVALATEYLVPWSAPVPLPADPPAVLAALPADYADPAASRAFLVRAGAAMLARHLARFGA
ncbi:MAG: FAD binding domain-containing protein [Gemmobacter sp.]